MDLDIEFPKPGRAWGLLSAPNLAAWHYDAAKDQLDDLDLLLRISVEGLPNLRAEHLGQAIRRRHELLLASAEVFSEVDLLLTPTTATTAYAAEGVLVGPVNGQEVDLMILSAAFTAPFNMTGQPGFSIPAGLVDGMPVGMQVVARRHEDDLCRRGRRAHGAGPPLAQARPRLQLDEPRFGATWYPQGGTNSRRKGDRPGGGGGWGGGNLDLVTDVVRRPGDSARAPRPPKQEQEPASEEITEVAPGVLRMQLPIWMPGLGHVNMYGLVDDRGLTVVDPGLPGPKSWKSLKGRLKSAGYGVKDIHTVVVTHSHPDHFGGAGRIKKEAGAELITHKAFTTWSLDRKGKGTLSEVEAERLEQAAIDEADSYTGPSLEELPALRDDDGERARRVHRRAPAPVGALGRHDAVGWQQAPDAAAAASA